MYRLQPCLVVTRHYQLVVISHTCHHDMAHGEPFIVCVLLSCPTTAPLLCSYSCCPCCTPPPPLPHPSNTQYLNAAGAPPGCWHWWVDDDRQDPGCCCSTHTRPGRSQDSETVCVAVPPLLCPHWHTCSRCKLHAPTASATLNVVGRKVCMTQHA
jgi:hypothetical protein